ncbi:hypothetical protein MTR67_011846 [Solanum verrucosum]|uniref:Tf2-1-like SH3-like domain-containing protein n=1 Tax=Solanum verrucosum TaxID=315347 RepID=A0AAF0QDF4_SOLVR|nr:hypothetical protein MTR67_011846 [Solanum verrucosum]
MKVERQNIGVDCMTKLTYLFLVQFSYLDEEYSKLYLTEMVRLHGIPLSIISDCGTQLTYMFWKSFKRCLGTHVKLLRLKTAQSQQYSYGDVRRRYLQFDVHYWINLKILPMKGVMRFGKKGKLSPHYLSPCMILRRFDKLAYELDLTNDLASVHPIFMYLYCTNVVEKRYQLFPFKVWEFMRIFLMKMFWLRFWTGKLRS